MIRRGAKRAIEWLRGGYGARLVTTNVCRILVHVGKCSLFPPNFDWGHTTSQ